MSLFGEQDYSPMILSPPWIAIKCRPNMLVECRSHIIAILESGLLFREDSALVEQLEVEWGGGAAGGRGVTRRERWLSAFAVLAAVVVAPPARTLSRGGACARVCLYAGCALAVRGGRRWLTRSCLRGLLESLAAYTLLARRMLVCIREYGIVKRDLECVSLLTATATQLLHRQQGALVTLLARCSLALLTSVPWLRHEPPWQAAECEPERADLTKLHHVFLVMQSSFLTQVAMAHFEQPKSSRKLFDNHNERIYWLHTQLLQHLYEEVKENHSSLERMYRMLRNYENNDSAVVKKGIALNDSWLYSDVHGGIARATIELKMATTRCTNLDVFLDNSATQKDRFDVEALSNDLDGLIDAVTMCLSTLQNSQIRLKKIHSRMNPSNVKCDLKIEENHHEKDTNILKIEDKDPESKDEVYFYFKTEEDNAKVESAFDVTTAPGKKERDATKIVLGELKRKLIKREDIMRHREKVALERTMPELKGKLPHFPRQIKIEMEETPQLNKGFISKIIKYKHNRENKLSKSLKLSTRTNKKLKISPKFIMEKIANNNKVLTVMQLKLSKLKHMICSDIITLSHKDKTYVLTKWIKINKIPILKDFCSTDLPEVHNGVETAASTKNPDYKLYLSKPGIPPNGANDQKFRKEDLELSLSSSESDLEFYKERKEQISLLKDIRRHRAARKKNHPMRPSFSLKKEVKNDGDIMDESLRPVEYSFGTGMALASVFHGPNGPKLPIMGAEEVFIGDGEVSSDSGNDEDS